MLATNLFSSCANVWHENRHQCFIQSVLSTLIADFDFPKSATRIIHTHTPTHTRTANTHSLWEVRQKECSKWQPNEFDFKWCVTAFAWCSIAPIAGEIFGRRLISVVHCNTFTMHTKWRCNMQRCTRFTEKICAKHTEFYLLVIFRFSGIVFFLAIRFFFSFQNPFTIYYIWLLPSSSISSVRFFQKKININFCQLF